MKKNILVCVLCLNRNYNTKPRANQNSKRLTLKKYCSYCNKHTLHQETK
ncbi:50S ribosomal protein L33 ['Elaeagnus angustifolia' witches'-broom phytoplasma]|uniref:Large ribosomal subunit protein bL33 n=3 Tax=16SrI (Aster yellows group) TaxID=3042590 RepID=A0ABS5V8C9_9MOLU|nr:MULTISPECIES: 50S ribosomal protein L33 [Phytoplasma]MBT1576596.1 50S ribosomal protein L33 ['Elaeagnus angustifolia' witches'-broom phytoplasma]MBY7576771.1 50S ribosomal protein L33 [Candidatus Phytoplasma australiense]MCX2955488.1 50S ribosomal protein L33 [Candidatus Phytoplasma australiense]QYC31063.1 50S ribosomal protein L33 [Paulownia witches'-broom phytoplasma]